MNILQKAMNDHAPLASGEYEITVLPDTAKLAERGNAKRLEFFVETDAGKRQTVSFAYEGAHDGAILGDLRRLDGWVRGVGADISDRRIGGDMRRIPAALAAAAVGKTVLATFEQKTGAHGGVFVNLISIRVEDAEPGVEFDSEYDEAGDE